MKIGRRVKVEKVETQTKSFTCDLCMQDIPEDRGYQRDERTLKYAEGSVYPETDARTHYKLDVCGTCFHEKLIPLLRKEYGATFVEQDAYDYFDKIEDETQPKPSAHTYDDTETCTSCGQQRGMTDTSPRNSGCLGLNTTKLIGMPVEDAVRVCQKAGVALRFWTTLDTYLTKYPDPYPWKGVYLYAREGVIIGARLDVNGR